MPSRAPAARLRLHGAAVNSDIWRDFEPICSLLTLLRHRAAQPIAPQRGPIARGSLARRRRAQVLVDGIESLPKPRIRQPMACGRK